MLTIGYFSLVVCFLGIWLLANPILFAHSLILVKKLDRSFQNFSSKLKPERKAITVISQPVTTPKPVDPATLPFSLSIAKIDLDTSVVANVDASDPEIYKAALKAGVAHAKGTAFPGQGKMVYIFGHSTDYSWNVQTYNALFYQVKALETGDEIIVKLGDQIFSYRVKEKAVVAADDMSLIDKNYNNDVLILQTCYPPGTTWKRLLVVASPKKGFGELIGYGN